jgi:hypothetical protein
MARLPYATPVQFAELMAQSGFPENTPQTNAFSMLALALAPAIGAPLLRLVLALLPRQTSIPGCENWSSCEWWNAAVGRTFGSSTLLSPAQSA